MDSAMMIRLRRGTEPEERQYNAAGVADVDKDTEFRSV